MQNTMTIIYRHLILIGDPLMNIHFEKMTLNDIPLWEKWITVPHVKEVWFIQGYETADYIYQKIQGNGHTYPFIISINDQPIGYIQYCDLYAYRTLTPNPKGLFTNEDPGTFCIDLFIGDTDYLNKGYGTKIIKMFTQKLINEFNVKKILIDPASSNKRAIRCYQKAGFSIVKNAHDGVTECTIMKFIPKKQGFYEL